MKTTYKYTLLKNLVAAIAATVLTASLAADEPRVFTVDNTGGPHADFTDLQEAMDAAEDGDIFHVLGSPIHYGGITVTRQVHLFGPGYNLARVHEEGYQNFHEATLGQVDFTAREEEVGDTTVTFSSANSSISGLRTGRITIRTSDVTVQHNYVTGGPIRSETISVDGVVFRAHRAHVRQNFVTGLMAGTGGIQLDDANALGSMILNNITRNEILANNAVVRNNITGRTSRFQNSTVENNIINALSVSTRESQLNNNLFFQERPDDNDFLAENFVADNQWNVDESLVFTETGAFDEQYELAENSPGREAGVGGVDVGPFDGPFPYEISGVPSLPRVKIMAPGPFLVSPNSDLTIPVKIKVD